MLYSAIIADPPWQYGSPKALVGCIKKDGTPSIQVNVDAQYPTMSLDAIKALDVPAAKNCLLFMWVTNPFLCDGSGAEVVKAWGFTPKNLLTWAKVQADGETPSMKTGHWFRSASEHVIVAVKGERRGEWTSYLLTQRSRKSRDIDTPARSARSLKRSEV